MIFKHILITGGAGFVGSSLAVMFRESYPDCKVVALDSLKRRGSELNLQRLKEHGVDFVHGDVRCTEDFDGLPKFDVLIDCSAEPSVQAGLQGSPRYVLNTNLVGTINCLEAARQNEAAFLFLSTSRVYPMGLLNQTEFAEDSTRYFWTPEQAIRGCSPSGVQECFPMDGPRSFYGASKYAGELLLEEYVHSYGMSGLINRCGVLAGPWQMGKVDQGVVTLWLARHHFKQELKYIGFGGFGKQVRDILHVEDLFNLLKVQMTRPEVWDGQVYNVGGGPKVSVSLYELTDKCVNLTGHKIPIGPVPDTNPVDVRIYVTDNGLVSSEFDWAPQKSVDSILQDTHKWMCDNESTLRRIFA